MSAERIPLFPLEVVLFPGTPLPLHIFEPRYKLMIRRCVEIRREFGVILARSDGTAGVGCTAEIVKVVKRYEDGRMDILTMGQTPYRVLEVFDQQPYLEAAVEFLEDGPGRAAPELQQKLLKLFDDCHTLLFGRASSPRGAYAEFSLAFQIAAELPLDLEFKQELLEIRSESERQSWLVERLEKWLPQLANLERVRGKAGGNGHGLG